MKQTATALLMLLAAAPVHADESRDRFVRANILAIVYHELGHAVIDQMELPIYGQEEDAADVMSVLMIDELYNEDEARALAYDSAFGYISDPEGTEEVPYWDLHGPDEQRYYNHVCLFYGANPDARDDIAEELGLPEDRAETCPDEYDMAISSWGPVLDEMHNGKMPGQIVFTPGKGADLANKLLEAEVRALNADFSFPRDLKLVVESCNEPNAWYYPDAVQITLCTEFVTHLEGIYQAFSAQ